MVAKRELPTIGVLPGWSAYTTDMPDRYLGSISKGIQAAARLKGCNLLLGWSTGRVSGSSNIRTAWPVVASNSDFVPIGPWNTDGLIVFAPLRNEARSQYIQRIRKDGHPVLFIATGEEGPNVSVSNEIGIRQAVAHLADHGHKRILFIAGDPTDLGDTMSRLNAYQSAISEFNLDRDPGLIIYGNHDPQLTYLALQRTQVYGDCGQ
jgi:hypothetical protein